MKAHCRTCGCHFPGDFEETLSPDCHYWFDLKFPPSFPVEFKRAIWNAYFAVPVDHIADETGLIINMTISVYRGGPYTGNAFEERVPGYTEWSDAQKRQFQKDLFKFKVDHLGEYLKHLDEQKQAGHSGGESDQAATADRGDGQTEQRRPIGVGSEEGEGCS